MIAMCIVQGRNEVRWHLGQETSLPHPCSNLRSFGSKCSVLKNVLMTLLGIFSPHSDSVLGELCPLAPSLRLRCHAMKIWKFSESKQIVKSERHELLFHEHLQFSSTIRHRSCTNCRQRLLTAFQVHSCSFVSLLCSGEFRVGGAEARLKRGLWWRHHTQPTVVITFDLPKIRPPKNTLLRQWHDWHSKRRKCKRVFMIHNFENTESWEDKAGNAKVRR